MSGWRQSQWAYKAEALSSEKLALVVDKLFHFLRLRTINFKYLHRCVHPHTHPACLSGPNKVALSR